MHCSMRLFRYLIEQTNELLPNAVRTEVVIDPWHQSNDLRDASAHRLWALLEPTARLLTLVRLWGIFLASIGFALALAAGMCGRWQTSWSGADGYEH